MRIRRIPSLLTVSTTILTAGLLISASLETPPNRSSNVKAAPQNTKPSRVSSPQPPSGFSTPLAEQRLVGGYWRIDHDFQPTLVITNVLRNVALPVTPLLYSPDGTEYQLPEINLSPAGVASIDIRAALGAAPAELQAHFSDFGSAAVKYVWHWSGAATSLVENRDAKRSLNFNFELRTPMAMKHPGAAANVQEGLWWREDPGVKGFLGLVNVARHTVDVHVRVLSDYGEFGSENRVTLQPNETRNLDILNGIVGSSGGIRLSYDGAEKDIVVAGGLENPQEGYSAQIPFRTISPGTKPSTVTLSSVGLMLGAPDPMMKFPAGTQFGVYLALRNTTSRPILISPTLYYTQSSEAIRNPLNPLVLAARQAKHWTPSELSKELGLPKFSGIINLVFSYQGSPSDVIMANGSIDQTKTYVFEVKMEGVGKSLGKGLKDWDVSNGNDTMISLLNPDDKDQDFAVTFFFDGGHYKLPVHLKAGASTMFNVSEIIMMQQPDADGNKIPPGTLHGTAVLAAASADPQWINVGVSVGIFNVSTATCGGHCPYCTDFIDFRVQADIGTAPVGQDTEFSSWAESSDYTWIDYTLQSQWTSSNIQVAQPSCCTVGAFTGVSTGSFTANASATLEGGNYDCPEDCNPTYYYKGATGTVTTPSATLNVHLGPGSKTPGDNLSFLDSSTTCSESLGLTNCYATTAWWLWDIEVAGSVSDDASKWTVSQTVVGLSKGYYVDTNGNLQPFTENVPQQDDTPSSTFIQQPTGQTLVFWIDAPGRYFKYSGFRVDSATTAYNFTSTITSKAYPSVSVSFAWYVKIIVNSGAQLDTSNSSAGPGSTSLNF